MNEQNEQNEQNLMTIEEMMREECTIGQAIAMHYEQHIVDFAKKYGSYLRGFTGYQIREFVDQMADTDEVNDDNVNRLMLLQMIDIATNELR